MAQGICKRKGHAVAEIRLNTHEVLEIVRKNVSLPDYIRNIYARPDGFVLQIKLRSLLPPITADIFFERYENGNIHLKIKTNGLIDLILKLFNLPQNEWFKIHPPEVSIDVNGLLRAMMRGVEVTYIDYKDEQFSISTMPVDN